VKGYKTAVAAVVTCNAVRMQASGSRFHFDAVLTLPHCQQSLG